MCQQVALLVLTRAFMSLAVSGVCDAVVGSRTAFIVRLDGSWLTKVFSAGSAQWRPLCRAGLNANKITLGMNNGQRGCHFLFWSYDTLSNLLFFSNPI